MRFGIIQFLGSNCDDDCVHVLKNVLKAPAVKLWHGRADLRGAGCLILAGGFSYGDYLRTGAMAARTPIMAAVRDFAEAGGPVLGICNGFQILCEAGLLPGTLMRNEGLQFICEETPLVVERNDTLFTRLYRRGETIRLPIAHMEGRYVADDAEMALLEKERRVLLRYAANPNGSAGDIAGIVNEKGNVFGLMPHPERVAEGLLGSTDGLRLFQGILQ